jgi:hypothetical protein
MQWRLTSTITITLLILALAFVGPNVSAHSGGIFTLIISKNGITPTNASMTVNDTARWINVDDSENVTHRIFVDSNGDGDYFGDDDWDSGNLTSSCETDANGTKVDDDCNASFDIPFNYTDSDGKYPFMDISSTGERTYGNVTVNPDDTHEEEAEEEEGEEAEEEEGEEAEEEEGEEDTDNDTKPTWLLAIAAISGIGAVVLGAMIVFGNKDED